MAFHGEPTKKEYKAAFIFAGIGGGAHVISVAATKQPLQDEVGILVEK